MPTELSLEPQVKSDFTFLSMKGSRTEHFGAIELKIAVDPKELSDDKEL